MKKTFYILLFCFLLALGSTVYAIQMIHLAGMGAGGGCSSGTVDPNADFIDHTPGDSNTKMYTTTAMGQSFQVSANGNIYSIKMYVSYHNANATITMRWGPGADLSSVYYDEVTSATITGTGDYEFVMADHDAISGSTTYYIGAIVSVDDTLYWRRDDGNGYANGQRYWGSAWNMDNTAAGADMIFSVLLCD